MEILDAEYGHKLVYVSNGELEPLAYLHRTAGRPDAFYNEKGHIIGLHWVLATEQVGKLKQQKFSR